MTFRGLLFCHRLQRVKRVLSRQRRREYRLYQSQNLWGFGTQRIQLIIWRLPSKIAHTPALSSYLPFRRTVFQPFSRKSIDSKKKLCSRCWYFPKSATTSPLEGSSRSERVCTAQNGILRRKISRLFLASNLFYPSYLRAKVGVKVGYTFSPFK